MEAIRAVGVVFTVLFGLWGVPVAWQHWSRERRLAALVERNGKVLAQLGELPGSAALPGVREVLEEDTQGVILRLAALKAVPTPRVAWVFYGFSWLLIPMQVNAYVRVGPTWQFLGLTALAAVLLLWLGRLMFALSDMRKEWVGAQLEAVTDFGDGSVAGVAAG